MGLRRAVFFADQNWKSAQVTKDMDTLETRLLNFLLHKA